MARSLVIVESPAKAKTINKYLGRGYTVKASYGHVMDLPTKTIGILLPGEQNGKPKKKRKSKAKGGAKAKAEKPAKLQHAGVAFATTPLKAWFAVAAMVVPCGVRLSPSATETVPLAVACKLSAVWVRVTLAGSLPSSA